MNIGRYLSDINYYFILCILLMCVSCRINKEKNFKHRAEQGDVQAMYALGQANLSTYGDGIVKRPNYRDAAHWFEMGAKRGHAPSMYWLTQIGGITNEERVMWLKKGAELGNETCIIELMDACRFGKYGLKADKGAGIYWELKRGELYLKRNQKSPEEIRATLAEWEQRYRRENKYDGPIRPLP